MYIHVYLSLLSHEALSLGVYFHCFSFQQILLHMAYAFHLMVGRCVDKLLATHFHSTTEGKRERGGVKRTERGKKREMEGEGEGEGEREEEKETYLSQRG